MSWKATLSEDLDMTELRWDEAEELAQDHEEWCGHIARCSTKAHRWTKVYVKCPTVHIYIMVLI